MLNFKSASAKIFKLGVFFLDPSGGGVERADYF